MTRGGGEGGGTRLMARAQLGSVSPTGNDRAFKREHPQLLECSASENIERVTGYTFQCFASMNEMTSLNDGITRLL